MKINKKRIITAILIGIILIVLSGCRAVGESNGSAETGGEAVHQSELVVVEEIIIGLLLIASIVGIVTNRLRVPYTVGLVLIGLLLAIRGQESINVTPNIFLALLVPPLIYEAAFHLNAMDLRRNIAPILALAIPGVLITTFLVGGVIAWGAGFDLKVALVFGALVAATDPVAVIALFRSLGVPKRLQVLMEGESLFNDGTAIVIFNLMVVIAVTGQFSLLDSVGDFLVVAGGGLAVGFLLGVLIAQLINRIHDGLITTTLTIVLAFGAYLIAEQFHVSGVLAVVAAGLVSGNIGPRGMSPSTRILVFNFWEIAAFIANSFIFLLIGLQIDLVALLGNWIAILWAILAILVARAVAVYGLSWIGPGMSRKFKHVIYWGGLRGAISLALVLSLPEMLRLELQTMTFGVVLFTLLVQGLSMGPLIRKMGLIQYSDARKEYEYRHARAMMTRSAYDRLQKMYNEGLISRHIWNLLSKPLEKRAELLADAATEALHADPALEAEEIDAVLRDLLQTQRGTLTSLLRDSKIAEETYEQLVGEVDSALIEPRTNMIELLQRHSHAPITRLMTVVVQEQDAENVVEALSHLGVSITRLPSTGSFLGRQNATLIIGVSENTEQLVIKTLQENAQQRVEILPTPPETSAHTRPIESAITVEGATIFTFDVERYIEL